MALGRGLESLIPKSIKTEESKNASASDKSAVSSGRQESIFYIETEKVKPNPYQPRRDFDQAELTNLAESMKQYGMIQPLLVSKIETEVASGTKVEYQLIAGERRLKAAGIDSSYMLLRLPALSGVDEVVESVDVSLNSELTVLAALSRAAVSRGRVHDVMLMVDLGDLREGIWPKSTGKFWYCCWWCMAISRPLLIWWAPSRWKRLPLM